MAITATAAGTAGTFSSSVASLATTAYNQAAGKCMYVVANGFLASSWTIADTAGNIFVPQLAFVGGNSNAIALWTVTNCLGNASNVVTVSASSLSTAFATLTYYDIGGCASVDIKQNPPTQTNQLGSISDTITTASANEIVLSTMFQDGAGLVSATAPSGFTPGSIVQTYSLTAYEIFSSIQTALTITWSSINSNVASYDMVTASFVASVVASSPNLRMMMGMGR